MRGQFNYLGVLMIFIIFIIAIYFILKNVLGGILG